MQNKVAAIVSSPFVAPNQTVGAIMRKVIYALIPAILVYFYFFGWGVIVNIVISVASALGWEALLLLARSRPMRVYLTDGSAIITGLLLALALPPMIVWWVPVVGTFFAIVAAKHLYGGLGYNPLNPAMAGYAVILISFPLEMTTWHSATPIYLSINEFVSTLQWVLFQALPVGVSIDSLTAATPLDHLKNGIGQGVAISSANDPKMMGIFAGRWTEWVNVAYLIGGLWLVHLRLVSWHMPVAILVTLALLSTSFYLYSPETFINPMMHIFGGATMLCAFFIATDPVTAPATPLAKIYYGVGIAVIIFIIRTWGGYPDAVAFAVLLMNLTVPLLDQYTIPNSFGRTVKRE